MGSRKILLISSDEVFSARISSILENQGYQMRLEKSYIDLTLPGGHDFEPELAVIELESNEGISIPEFCELIRMRYHTPVVLIYNTETIYLIEDAMKASPDCIVNKAICEEDLPVQIEFLFSKIHPDDERQKENKISSGKAVYDEIKRLEEIIYYSRDAIFLLDMDGNVLFWSKSCEKIFKISYDSALNRKIYDLIISAPYIDDFKSIFESEDIDEDNIVFNTVLELYARKKGGDLIPVEIKLASMEIEGRLYIAGYARDVTERIIAEEELTKLIEELQVSKDILENNANEMITLNSKLSESEEELTELNAAKDKFFSIIAHDLKGPFQGLMGYSDVLASDIEKLDKDDIKVLAESLNDSAQRLFKLLENLLSWSRLQRNRMELRPENIDLHEMAMIGCQLIKPAADQKNIELYNRVSEDAVAYADYQMVDTIIRNLLSNAVKFTPQNGEVVIDSENINDHIMLKVSDSGVGMNDNIKSNLFRIDKSITTPGTNNESGTGLGLILCKELIEKNHGTISVESEEGDGTTFKFTLLRSDNQFERENENNNLEYKRD